MLKYRSKDPKKKDKLNESSITKKDTSLDKSRLSDQHNMSLHNLSVEVDRSFKSKKSPGVKKNSSKKSLHPTTTKHAPKNILAFVQPSRPKYRQDDLKQSKILKNSKSTDSIRKTLNKAPSQPQLHSTKDNITMSGSTKPIKHADKSSLNMNSSILVQQPSSKRRKHD